MGLPKWSHQCPPFRGAREGQGCSGRVPPTTADFGSLAQSALLVHDRSKHQSWRPAAQIRRSGTRRCRSWKGAAGALPDNRPSAPGLRPVSRRSAYLTTSEAAATNSAILQMVATIASPAPASIDTCSMRANQRAWVPQQAGPASKLGGGTQPRSLATGAGQTYFIRPATLRAVPALFGRVRRRNTRRRRRRGMQSPARHAPQSAQALAGQLAVSRRRWSAIPSRISLSRCPGGLAALASIESASRRARDFADQRLRSSMTAKIRMIATS